jgi:hypothetical protein
MSTLRSIFTELKKCSANQNHYFFPHVPNCPWCERAALFGKDNFQSVIGQQIALVDPGANTFSDKEKIEYLSQLIEVAISDGSISSHEQAFLISQGRKLQLSESVVRNMLAGATSGTASVQPGRSSRTQTPKSGSQVAPPVVTTQSVPSASQPKGGAAYAVRRFANRALLLMIFIVVPAVLALEKCSG